MNRTATTQIVLNNATAEAIELLEFAVDAYEAGMTATDCLGDVACPDWSLAARLLARGAVAEVGQHGLHPTKRLMAARAILDGIVV